MWSSEDDCLSIISQDLEHLLQPSNTIEQILDRVCVLLETAEKGAASNKGEEEEEEEEEEEGLDDYYGDDMDVYDDDPTEKKRLEFICFLVLHTDTFLSNSDDKEVSANDFFIGQGSPAAVHRLLAGNSFYPSVYDHAISMHPQANIFFFGISDLKSLKKSSSKYGIAGQPINVRESLPLGIYLPLNN